MNRFWLFPLLMGLVGVFLPLLVVCEGAIPVFLANVDLWSYNLGSFLSSLPYVWRQLVDFMKEVAPYGGSAGTVVGLGLAVFDWWRNGRSDRMGIYATAALMPNLWWCGVYAGVLSLINGLIFSIALRLFESSSDAGFLWFIPMALAGILNAVAVLWGGIRCITSEEVLSLDVLRGKLRRSARLSG